MTKIKSLSLALLIALTATGCGLKVAGVDVGKTFESVANVVGSGSMSANERFNWGVEMTAVLLGATKVHPNQDLQLYVNQVGSWVASHANLTVDDEQFTDWRFIVVDSKDFNAFAMPGGFIIISSGAIEMLSSEAELAAILAHEIIHIEQDHQVNAILDFKRTEGLTNLAFLANDARQVSRRDITPDYIIKRVVSAEVANVAHKLYLDGISRDDERDADSKAVVLLTRAGYDPYAYLSVLQMIDSLEDDRKVILSSTHPDIEDRLATAFESIHYVDSYLARTQTGQQRFASMME